MRLNLASGGLSVPGFTNVDDCIYPLAYQDVSVIRCSHCLEHFGTEESIYVLQNWISCLKPGGILKVAVPDFDDLMRRKDLGQRLNFEGIIMGGQVDERDYHKSLWNTEKLAHIMLDLGLIDIRTWQSEIVDCASLPYSLNLMGYKP